MRNKSMVLIILIGALMWAVVHSVMSFQQRVERKAAEVAYRQGWIEKEKQYKKQIIEAFHSGWHIAIVWNDCKVDSLKSAYKRDSVHYFEYYFPK